MRSKNSWNKEYETKVDKNGKKHTRMVKHGMKQSKKSLAFSKHVNKMKTDKPKWNKKSSGESHEKGGLMKIRKGFVTNSSSSSFIICFARIADKEKAQKIIDQFNLDVLDVTGVNDEKNWSGELGASWCGAVIYGVDDILEKHPDGEYIVIEDRNDAYYDEWGDAVYDYDFSMNEAIDAITEVNGFADIEVAEGEGRDG